MSALKILHVSYSDSGGAAIAAARIHLALMQRGIQSTYLSCRAQRALPSSQCLYGAPALWVNRGKNKVASLLLRLTYPDSGAMNLFPSGLHNTINATDADLVHLHWPHAEMMSIEEIGKLNKPIVWTTHDLWSVLGVGGYFVENERRLPAGFTKDSFLPSKRPWLGRHIDVDRWCWERKRRAWADVHMHFVGPSQWIADHVGASPLVNPRSVHVVPNCLDQDIFKPRDRRATRRDLGLPDDRPIILFGSAANQAHRKGFDLLVGALHSLNENVKHRAVLAVFGGPKSRDIAGIEAVSLGAISDEHAMARVYSAADVMCVPSRQDNFPNTIGESLACGTPVIAFRVGGIPEMLDHRHNGYLATPFDTRDFAAGIEWALEATITDDHDVATSSDELSRRARTKAQELFSMEIVAEKYEKVYRQALQDNRG